MSVRQCSEAADVEQLVQAIEVSCRCGRLLERRHGIAVTDDCLQPVLYIEASGTQVPMRGDLFRGATSDVKA